ncbi:MAG TPA: 3-oxoacyl-[acyl-carrier-protein] reductase [Cyanobacteria bacterium UBA8530]|nr:3-oxoacyl-[acyl-carrier-protein] reductase [Cyanobacteria bacterium UBA8530]
MKLLERVALVTGASRGIGKACALALARSGADLALNYYPGLQAEAEGVVAEIEALGRRAIAVEGDVSSAESVEKMVAETLAWQGKIDVLVNNAGITRDGLLIRMSEKDWDEVLSVNLKGVFLVTKAVAKAMVRQRRGRIVNVSSVVGLCGNAGQSNYSASKAGVIGFTKSIALELGGRDILVNAVAPGFIASEMTEKLSQEVKEAVLKTIPLGRFGQPEEVAEVVAFLAETSYLTGQVIPVDGGMHT